MVHYGITFGRAVRFLCGSTAQESWVPCVPPSPSQHLCVTCWECKSTLGGRPVPPLLPYPFSDDVSEEDVPATFAAGAPPDESRAIQARDAAVARQAERNRLMELVR